MIKLFYVFIAVLNGDPFIYGLYSCFVYFSFLQAWFSISAQLVAEKNISPKWPVRHGAHCKAVLGVPKIPAIHRLDKLVKHSAEKSTRIGIYLGRVRHNSPQQTGVTLDCGSVHQRDSGAR